jgi:predicted HTH transcriptional regulator
LIAKAFKEAGVIERYGSGIIRVCNICKEYGVKKPNFYEMPNGFKAVLYNEKVADVTDNVADVTDDVTDVTDVTDNVTDNVTDVTDDVTDVTDNVTDVTDNVTDVTDNVADVTDNVADVTDNVADVTDNVTDVTDNVADVTDDITDVTDNVTNRTKVILNFIMKNDKITASEIAKDMGVTKRTILRDIEKLKKENLLERIGPEKGGHWRVKK